MKLRRVGAAAVATALAAGAGLAVAAGAPSATPPLPTFRGSVTALSAAERRAMTPSAWRPGCPVGQGALRAVRALHVGFDGRAHHGVLVVNRDVAARVLAVLRSLYALRTPIRSMRPVEAFGGSDFRSIEADNTSAFNCRFVDGTRRWSQHAYGRAIDLNPIENPYIAADGTTSHPASRVYLDRSRARPGVVRAGDAVVRAFAAGGFAWGGAWTGARDTQHFSATGT
jgi:hypothetical protein